METNNHEHETQIMAHIPGETIKKAGRPSNKITYVEMEYHICGSVIHNGNPLEFKFDKEDLEKVKSRHWYAVTDGKYIGCHITINNSIKMLYLHNFVMNRFIFPGKGAKESIDHINRDGLDNRKENLRLVTQTQQNINQKARARTATFPEGITELPKHVWYIKANGLHGDRFGIDLKSEKFKWKTTSSKKVSIHDKLNQAIEKLNEVYTTYPHLKPTQTHI
jgi:hypothetical protein